jgi:hypothetical protein
MPLGPLRSAEALTPCASRNASAGDARAAVRVAGGNPLLLALAGEMALREPDPQQRERCFVGAAAELIMARLRRERVDAAGIAMLEAASLVPHIDEEMLAAMLERDDEDDFHRFTHLSLVVQGAAGYSIAEPFRSLLALDLLQRRPRWCRETAAKVARQLEPARDAHRDSPRLEESVANPDANAARGHRCAPALLADVRAALEWLRQDGGHETCPLAAHLAVTGPDASSQVRLLLAGIIRSLQTSRAPRVAEAGRLLEVYYLGRSASVETVGESLDMSRSTAFRRLRLGVELVAERLTLR